MSTEPDTFSLSLTEHAMDGANLWEQRGMSVDSRGRYVHVVWQSNFAGSGDDAVRVELSNEGKPVKLKRVQHSMSQGADDGRAFIAGGHRTAGVTGIAGSQQFLHSFGAGDVNGRGRTQQTMEYSDDIAPILDYNDAHYWRHVGDSASTDETKFYTSLWYVPADSDGSGTTL